MWPTMLIEVITIIRGVYKVGVIHLAICSQCINQSFHHDIRVSHRTITVSEFLKEKQFQQAKYSDM